MSENGSVSESVKCYFLKYYFECKWLCMKDMVWVMNEFEC